MLALELRSLVSFIGNVWLLDLELLLLQFHFLWEREEHSLYKAFSFIFCQLPLLYLFLPLVLFKIFMTTRKTLHLSRWLFISINGSQLFPQVLLLCMLPIQQAWSFFPKSFEKSPVILTQNNLFWNMISWLWKKDMWWLCPYNNFLKMVCGNSLPAMSWWASWPQNTSSSALDSSELLTNHRNYVGHFQFQMKTCSL